MTIKLPGSSSPASWIKTILEEGRARSHDRVERLLVGALLGLRFPTAQASNRLSGSTAGRGETFRLGTTCFHAAARPGQGLLHKATENLSAGLHPYLLVPNDQVPKACCLAEQRGIVSRVSIWGIEDFMAVNIIWMCGGKRRELASTLRAVIRRYNRRLEEVETDMSLKIELQ